MTIFISIDYNGNRKDPHRGYECVNVSADVDNKNIENHRFRTRDFVRDWYWAMKWTVENFDVYAPVLKMSSVDHFIMDGANFDSAYLRVDGKGNAKLSYKYKFDDPGIEFFVPKGKRWSWGTLKRACGDRP